MWIQGRRSLSCGCQKPTIPTREVGGGTLKALRLQGVRRSGPTHPFSRAMSLHGRLNGTRHDLDKASGGAQKEVIVLVAWKVPGVV